MRVAIIGAGIAGLACAERLSQHAIEVALFDKGRKPGGRLASVAIDDMAWDIGAQCFAATTAEFAQQAARWQAAGLVSPWAGGPDGSLAGVPSMASVVAAQAATFDVHFSTLVHCMERLGDAWHLAGGDCRHGPFSAVIVAVPAEQAAPLLSLHDLDMAREAAAIRSTPCWTVMVAFSARAKREADLLSSAGPIAAAIRSASKPGRPAGECWVLQASADWSSRHLEYPREDVADLLLGHFAQECGGTLPPVTFAKAHRWRFALPHGVSPMVRWNAELKLGACGDWCSGPTVEDAWLSGTALGNAVAAALQKPAMAGWAG